jgi:hypothetical protein
MDKADLRQGMLATTLHSLLKSRAPDRADTPQVVKP